MEIRRGHNRYWTVRFDDHEAGCSGLRVHREGFGESKVVATVIYWDAAPGFFIETLGEHLPVEVAIAAMREAENQIKFK
jgi:hypothetical protein